MRSSISWASYEPLSSSSGAKQTTALAVIEVDRLSDQIEWYLKVCTIISILPNELS